MGILLFEWLVFFANLLLLFIYLKLSHKFHWFDQPDEDRKIHQIAIPTSAGLIFMLPMVLAFLLLPAWFPAHSYAIGFTLLSLLIMGGLDDFLKVSVKLRLLIVASACVFFLYFMYLDHDINYALLTVYFFGLVWWLNLYNFMDGADGMSVLHAIITTCGYMFAFTFLENSNVLTLVFLILFLLCLISFFLFNFPKAKLFMGDSGSFSVSFLLAAFALFGISENIFDQILVISFHLVFIVDATLTLFTRLYFKHSLSKAHNLHLFQALINDGKTHVMVSVLYATITLFTVMIALYLAYQQVDAMTRFMVLILESVVLSIIWYLYHNRSNFVRFQKSKMYS